MAEKFEELARVIRQEEIATDIYSLWLVTEQIAAHAKPGQFVSLYCNEGSRLLPRPVSICEIDRENGGLRLVYRIAGEGTREFSNLCAGAQVKVVGPARQRICFAEEKGVFDRRRYWDPADA